MDNNGGTQPSTAPPVNPEPPRSPVMDVVARKPADAHLGHPEIAPPQDVMAQIAPPEAPKPVYKQPIADMVKPPAPKEAPKSANETKPPSKAELKAQAKAEKAARPKPVNQAKHGSGVGAAIAATVIVVLGLAGLAVYAYLQSK